MEDRGPSENARVFASTARYWCVMNDKAHRLVAGVGRYAHVFALGWQSQIAECRDGLCRSLAGLRKSWRRTSRLLDNMQRALHRHGLAVDDGEKHARGTMRLSSTLFPLTHGRGGKAEPCGEGGLRQVQFLPDGPHVDPRRRDNGQSPGLGQFPPPAIRRNDRRVFPNLARDLRFGCLVDFRPINLCRSRLGRGDAHDSALFLGHWLCGRR